MSLKYEPSSEPLHISAKWLFLNGFAHQVVCNIKVETQDLAALKGDIDSYSMRSVLVRFGFGVFLHAPWY